MSKRLTHLDETGTARMVDVGAKPATQRMAKAGGIIRMSSEALAAIKAGDAPKGDVLGRSRFAIHSALMQSMSNSRSKTTACALLQPHRSPARPA
jgi:molybdenum cofactor biosynthesis enzyme